MQGVHSIFSEDVASKNILFFFGRGGGGFQKIFEDPFLPKILLDFPKKLLETLPTKKSFLDTPPQKILLTPPPNFLWTPCIF